jgi:sequestosome 1
VYIYCKFVCTDSENDFVLVSSDDELLEALGFVNDGLLRLYIRRTDATTGENQEQVLHPNVTCDGCNGPVKGKRYKCMTCPDYDLCETCEGKNIHPEHELLRITAPRSWRSHIPPPPYWGLQRGGPWGMGRGGMGPCDMGLQKEGQPQPSEGNGPADCCPPGGSQFGFPFMNRHWRRWNRCGGGGCPRRDGERDGSGRCGGRRCQKNEGKTENMEQGHDKSEHSQQQGQGENAGRNSPTEDYLKYVGSSVAALLDPLGIDVEIDVEHKGQTRRCGSADFWGPGTESGCDAGDKPAPSTDVKMETASATAPNSETGESTGDGAASARASPKRNAETGDSDWTMISTDGSAAAAVLGHALQLSAEQRHGKYLLVM